MLSGDFSTDNRRVAGGTPQRELRWGLLLIVHSLLVWQGGCSALSSNHEVLRADSQSRLGDSSHLIGQALHQYHAGHLDQAASKFEQALAIAPDHGVAHNNLGLIHYQRRQLVPAADHFDAAISLLPRDPRPINNLGMTLEAGGRVMEAIELYAEASALDPTNPLYLGNWLRARVRMGEFSDYLIEQLEHLAFIETRSDWLSWTDEQLAVHRNSALDRGPSRQPNIQRAAVGNRLTAPKDTSRQGVAREDRRADTTAELLPPVMELHPSDAWGDEPETLPVPAPAPPLELNKTGL